MRVWACACLLLMAAGPAAAQNVLTLEAAIETARAHAPELAQAQTSVQAAKARADAARAPLLPQLSGALGYERRTFNSGAAASAESSSDQLSGTHSSRSGLSTRALSTSIS